MCISLCRARSQSCKNTMGHHEEGMLCHSYGLLFGLSTPFPARHSAPASRPEYLASDLDHRRAH